jgi:peptide chain release factor 1
MDFRESCESIRIKYLDLRDKMSDPAIIQDQPRFARIHKEYKECEPVVEAWENYCATEKALQDTLMLLKDPDVDMREMAQTELPVLKERCATLEQELKALLIPKDPEDSKNVIVEIRSGTGGDEASIFAGDLYRMYAKYCEERGWKIETLDSNAGTMGGFSRIVAEIKGQDVYGTLKFESGAHRVQRVPVTESQGRVHTSAATVAVLPEVEMEEVNINKADLKIDTFRSSGAGGQHVNKTESGVRITHIPTGTVSESTDGRSQIQNREIAFQRLYQKIKNSLTERHEQASASLRRSLVGTGDRSDKIRTYNYPQNRVTDHRINLTVYNLDQVMEGSLHTILDGLRIAENAERMQSMELT